jgi:hypothetical protein
MKMCHADAVKRLGVAALLVLTFGLFGASPVAGACAPPLLTVVTDGQKVYPGSVITIEGRYFGDNCYDNSPPPNGAGTSGMPWQNIDIVLAQNGREHLVATGNAGAGYDFSVDVVVPGEVEVGAMSVTAKLPAQGASGDLSVSADQEIQVTAGEASAPFAVARFGPIEPAQPVIYNAQSGDANSGQSDRSSLFDGLSWLWWALGMLAVGFLAGRKLPRPSDGS